MAAQCESNYLRLLNVARAAYAAHADGPNPLLDVPLNKEGEVLLPDFGASLCLKLCDVAPYTTTLILYLQPLPSQYPSKSLDFLECEDDALTAAAVESVGAELLAKALSRPMKVRLYHDLKMAEVTDFADKGVGKSRYDYPNTHMLASDERMQQNTLLGEWLSRALANGALSSARMTTYMSDVSQGEAVNSESLPRA